MLVPERVIRWCLVGLLAGFTTFCWSAAFAQADPYTAPEVPGGATEPTLPAGTCPEAPAEAYEGEDESAGEIRALRADLSTSCGALVGRADELAHRLWWLTAQLAVDHGQRAVLLERVEALEVRLGEPLEASVVGVDAEHPLAVDGGASEGSADSAELVESVDAAGESSQAGLYVIAGLLVALFMGFAISKVVDRAT